MNRAADRICNTASDKALAASAPVSLECRDPRNGKQVLGSENAAQPIHDHKARQSNDILLALKLSAEG